MVNAYELYATGWPPSEGLGGIDHLELEKFLLFKNVVKAIETETDFDP